MTDFATSAPTMTKVSVRALPFNVKTAKATSTAYSSRAVRRPMTDSPGGFIGLPRYKQMRTLALLADRENRWAAGAVCWTCSARQQQLDRAELSRRNRRSPL